MPEGTLLHDCDREARLLQPEYVLARLLAATRPIARTGRMPRHAALGHVLAAPVRSATSLPSFDQAAMDGYALTATDLAEGTLPVVVRRIAAGDAPGAALMPGTAARVLTGAMLPVGSAAVVMQEHADERQGRLVLRRAVEPGRNIRRRGEDVAAGAEVLPAGRRLGAREMALLAALAIPEVTVRTRLRVGVLSNGNELAQGVVQDSNRPMLLALLQHAGCESRDLGLVRDEPQALARALREAAASCDVIVTSGGISGSDADHLPEALRAAGGAVEVLRLAQKPGKPLAHGHLGAARCLLLPGNPVAALVAMLTLGLPLLAQAAGEAARPVPLLPARVGRGFARAPGRVEYRPARVLRHDADGLPLLGPLGRGSSAGLLPLTQSDGLMRLPAEAEHLEAGQPVAFLPFPYGC